MNFPKNSTGIFSVIVVVAYVTMTTMLVGCRDLPTQAEYLPNLPDYADSAQWYASLRGGDADIFYIVSTETGDYALPDGRTAHYADTYCDSLRAPLHGEMAGVDELLSGQLNFFSPYYRQCSLQSFTSESLTKARMPLATDDVRRAFRHYLTHLNQGRPFILAGFSQGAFIMLDLLQEMDNETYGRMIAAYAIGIGVSDKELERNKHLVPARGADDTGVTICYNSVRDTACAMWKSNVAINPVNWRTDTTAAMLVTEPSPLLPIESQKKDTMTVRLDPQSGLLCIKGFTATDYVLPLIGKEGNYHSREIWLYREHLRQNMALRAEKFLKKYSRLNPAF